MRISTKLTLAALVPAIMAVVMAVGLLASGRAVREWRDEQEMATTVSADVNEMSELARAYVLTRGERPRRQFLLLEAEAADGLRSLERQSGTSRRELRELRSDLTIVRSLFLRLSGTYERDGGTSDADLFREAESRLSAQLFIRLRSANTAATQLARSISEDIVVTQQRFSRFATALTALAAVVLTVALVGLIVSITRGLAVLSAGTERVGRGDLDHRIGLRRRDELGELGRSFDRMTAQLKALIVTRGELEREVEARIVAQERERLQARTSTELAEISASLATMTDLDEELHDALLRACELLGAVAGAFFERVDGGWRTREVYGGPVGEVDVIEPVLASDAWTEVLESGEPLLVSDVRGRGEAEAASAANVGYGSYVVYPLSVRGEVNGTLAFYFEGSKSELPEPDQLFLSRLAYIISVSIENSRLLVAEREARERAGRELETTTHLLAAARSLAQWTDVRRLLSALAEVVHDATEHSRTTVFLWDESAAMVELAAQAGLEPMGEIGIRYPTARVSPASRRLLDQHRPGVVDFDAMPQEERELSPARSARLMFVAPVYLGERLYGFISIDDPGERGTFSHREREIVEAIAAQAAVALDHARLYESEHDIAERLQSAMLAMPGHIPGIEYDSIYRSAAESARVGGDFYDLFEIDDRLLGITIGDIAGKGLSAAVLTSLVKNAIRAHAAEKAGSPGRILELTNEVVYQGTESDSFATVFFAVLDRSTGCITYASAGHTTSFVMRRDGDALRLEPTGPLLGAFRQVAFRQQDVPCLKPGDLLFLYTDGIIEARSEIGLYGEQRLFDALSLAPLEPHGAISAVLEEVTDFAHGQLSDDAAILAVRIPEA